MRIPLLVEINNIKEWIIIELQGKITSRTNNYENESIGPLIIENDIAKLTIGNHSLEGKIIVLKKPLAVIKKGNQDGLTLTSIIRKKILFPERPNLIF